MQSRDEQSVDECFFFFHYIPMTFLFYDWVIKVCTSGPLVVLKYHNSSG